MANERVSQLIELYATDLSSEDLFLITDMSQRESKKLEMGQLLLFIEKSGSFEAYNAKHADTASYIKAYQVDGNIELALFASKSISSSWADRSLSASYSKTASYADFAKNTGVVFTNADTASFLKYQGVPNGTSSYAMNVFQSDISKTASYLFYNGNDNGTSYRSISASVCDRSKTASYSEHLQLWAPFVLDETKYSSITMYGGVSDGVKIICSGSWDSASVYFRSFDNGDEPFLFQTWDSTAGLPPVDRVKIGYRNKLAGSTLMTVYGDVSASVYSSNLDNGVGFVGTSSYAMTASYVAPQSAGPKFITPITIASTTYANAGVYRINTALANSKIPPTATSVICDGYGAINIGSNVGFITIAGMMLTAYQASGQEDKTASGAQGVFPLRKTGEFTRELSWSITGEIYYAEIRIVGYY